MLVPCNMFADKVQCFLNLSYKCIYGEKRDGVQSVLQTQHVTVYVFAVININTTVYSV
jgi:hypothetical protein